MRVHTYVIAVDSGGAPNYDAPAVTLAVCKPRIRKKARVGELVLAFTGASVGPEPHAVCWAGVVRETLSFADYWNDRRFATKKPKRSPTPDNIYQPGPHGLVQVENGTHGPDSYLRDTSGERVLVFDPAWRFGAFGPVLPESFGLRMVGGRRGERVHELSERTWQRLQAWLDAQPEAKVGSAKRGGTCTPRPPKAPEPAPVARRRRC